MFHYRFPEGVEFLGEDGLGQVRMTVSVPADEEGHVGRECPSCGQHFRIASDDYQALPNEQLLWCVYCGHQDEAGRFTTAQQLERAKRAAADYAMQKVRDTLQSALGGSSLNSHNSPLQISYHTDPFYPQPLPGVSEERLVRERSCPACRFRYAVFGEHRFCPVCGQLPALLTALDSLAAETTRLDALTHVPAAQHAELRESGVIDRTCVDTIENAVGIVENLARRTFGERVPGAEDILKGRGQVFQRLDDLADLFLTHLGIDVRERIGPTWTELQESWATRHVFTHCDGIVDSKYLTSVPTSTLKEGQRLIVTEQMAHRVLRDAELLCRTIAEVFPKSRPQVVPEGSKRKAAREDEFSAWN
ncbi:MAG: hypothetical protein OXI56_06255 [bacterium]|nr:hypothetical protein [bacterium]